MKNFNTNQTRQLYVGAKVADVAAVKAASVPSIALGTTKTGEMFFTCKTADGQIVRSDTFDPKKIVSLKDTKAADLAIKLGRELITLDTSVVELDADDHLDNYKGKTFSLIVTTHQVVSYDESDTMVDVAPVHIVSGMAAADFYKALAITLVKGMSNTVEPAYKVYAKGASADTEITKEIAAKYEFKPNGTIALKSGATDTTDYSGGAILEQAPQKFVLGKLSNEPLTFSVAFTVSPDNDDVLVWGTSAAQTPVNSISGAYALAELDYFARGERGDYYRGSFWPNDYPFTPAIDLTQTYSVLSVEYFWSGDAENVQKSPRLIQVAGSAADVTAFYTTINAAR